jgi:hypothetical protein
MQGEIMEQYKDYEENLKDYLDIVKDDLKILLTSTIPTQKNLMKTLLWVNMSILGFLIAIISKNSSNFILYQTPIK